ncbi:MAG: hypothetical protein JG767_1771 [Deferribacteraceae bacterium]|jgi:hypothetical protein|nr:hypothetical protein [Deferribacteraceae bacterium]
MKKIEFDKNKVYQLLIFIGISFTILYWSKLYFDNKYNEKKSEISVLTEKYSKVYSLFQQTNIKSYILEESLMVFIQDTLSRLNLADKMASLKPQNTSTSFESVILRLENMNLNQIISVIGEIDKYSNTKITQLSQSRRFDNEEYADLILEIVKTK